MDFANVFQFYTSNATALLILLAVLGLAVGSFLNVVVYRLPIMLTRKRAGGDTSTPFTLSAPDSHCPRCNHALQWYENVPVLSWLALRGKCSSCRAPISARYPLVELLTSGLFVGAGAVFGPTSGLLGALLLLPALVALAFISYDRISG